MAAAGGAAAGLVASIVQVVVGKTEERLLLPPHENADIAPRFVGRLAERLGTSLPESARWILGTLFHFGYGALWGVVYVLVTRAVRRPPPPLVGGSALGALLYALAFAPIGAAVQVGAERPPGRRTPQMTFVAWSVALTYGLVTALLCDRMRLAPGDRID